MALFAKKASMPTREQALPGRAQRMPVAPRHADQPRRQVDGGTVDVAHGEDDGTGDHSDAHVGKIVVRI